MQRFYKYHGAGNDFVLIDNRTNSFVADAVVIRALCHRRMGIGADGFVLLNEPKIPKTDFEMRYFNSDGFEGTMCGNGGRCIVSFARRLGIIDDKTVFSGIDGLHQAKILSCEGDMAVVSLRLKDVLGIKSFDDGYFIDTGSPHVVKFVADVHAVDMEEGKRIRNDVRFERGTNVNFVEILKDNTLFVRTYERGVEGETLSCGTGVTASALAFAKRNDFLTSVAIQTYGGKFCVGFRTEDDCFFDVDLQGETCFVFEGILPRYN
jgi:diaminopimelate epimerase